VSVEPAFRDQMLAAVPSLRAFAISLCGSHDRADDLVQDTLMRAWKNVDRFEPGTNLNAWLFTILRNLFHSEYRKRKREVEDPDGLHAGRLATRPEQGARLDFEDFQRALTKLQPDQREALLLVGAEGFSYEEAAAICNVAVGTVKSRVNRARKKLEELLSFEEEDDFGPDRMTRAALQATT
jgi:RNA polymerase sigma-70 factor (ECF subfamily)